MARTHLDDDRVIIERHSGSTMGALLAGIAIGAGIALLFAPQSGADTRQLVRRRAKRARRLAADYATDMRDRASDLVADTRERGRDLVDGARERIEDTIDDTRRTLRDKRRELSRAVEEGRVAARDAKSELERRLADAQRRGHAHPDPDGDAVE
jgi:gas vesicle protein